MSRRLQIPQSKQISRHNTNNDIMINNFPNVGQNKISLMSPKAVHKNPYIKNQQNYNCQKLPLVMNPSFQIKFTNTVRHGFVKFIETHPNTSIVNESMLLEEYAQKKNLNYVQSHDLATRTYLRQKHVGLSQGQKKFFKKSNLRYFQLDDSNTKEEDIDMIMNHRTYKVKKNKDDDKPLDKIFRHSHLDSGLNALIEKTHGNRMDESRSSKIYTSNIFLSAQEL